MNKKAITGCKGENLAAEYLAGLGYRVIEKNWRWGHKEVDIVAMDGDILVIVEVKTRTSGHLLTYEDVLPPAKQKFLMEAAEHYIREKNVNSEVRFDLIFINLQNELHQLDHLVSAFNAEI